MMCGAQVAPLMGVVALLVARAWLKGEEPTPLQFGLLLRMCSAESIPAVGGAAQYVLRPNGVRASGAVPNGPVTTDSCRSMTPRRLPSLFSAESSARVPWVYRRLAGSAAGGGSCATAASSGTAGGSPAAGLLIMTSRSCAL